MSRHVLPTTTAHFAFVWYDDVGPDPADNVPIGPDAQANIEAVVPIAEADLATLAGWFGVTIDDSFRNIEVRTNWFNGGSNGGYTDAPGINLESPVRLRREHVADEIVRAVFVQELAEILMDYRGQTVPGSGPWNALDSAGEGLSRVAGAELHPLGYYDGGYATLGSWTGAGGPNWVDTTFTGNASYPGDGFWPSFGCAVAFLYYLHTQLGLAWNQIVTAGGATLQDKYAALGLPGRGFDAMTALLNTYYGSLNDVATNDDDPFPLYNDGRRSVAVDVATTNVRPGVAAGTGTATLSPGGTCPPAPYGYTIYALSPEVAVTGQAFGFGVPIFEWTINGTPLSLPTAGTRVDVTLSALVTSTDPNQTGAPPASQEVTITIETLATDVGAPTSSFRISTGIEAPGTIDLAIGADVTEQRVAAPTVAGSNRAALATTSVVYDNNYYTDRRVCTQRLQRQLEKLLHSRIPPYITDIRPDPSPIDRAVSTLIVALRSTSSDLRKVDPKEADALTAALADAFAVDRGLIAP